MAVMKQIPKNLIATPLSRVNIVPQNNINVSLAEGQTVSWEQNDDAIEFPGFIGLKTKANNTILLQTISIPLMTKRGSVEDLIILLDSGSDRSLFLIQ